MSCDTILKNASDLDKRYPIQDMIIVSTNPFVDIRLQLKIFMDAFSLPKDVNVVMCINCHVTVKSILIIVFFLCCKYHRLQLKSLYLLLSILLLLPLLFGAQERLCNFHFPRETRPLRQHFSVNIFGVNSWNDDLTTFICRYSNYKKK